MCLLLIGGIYFINQVAPRTIPVTVGYNPNNFEFLDVIWQAREDGQIELIFRFVINNPNSQLVEMENCNFTVSFGEEYFVLSTYNQDSPSFFPPNTYHLNNNQSIHSAKITITSKDIINRIVDHFDSERVYNYIERLFNSNEITKIGLEELIDYWWINVYDQKRFPIIIKGKAIFEVRGQMFTEKIYQEIQKNK